MEFHYFENFLLTKDSSRENLSLLWRKFYCVIGQRCEEGKEDRFIFSTQPEV